MDAKLTNADFDKQLKVSDRALGKIDGINAIYHALNAANAWNAKVKKVIDQEWEKALAESKAANEELDRINQVLREQDTAEMATRLAEFEAGVNQGYQAVASK